MAFAALVPLSGESSHDLSDRLVSLLREWDDDGSCTASRRDVQMALTALGLPGVIMRLPEAAMRA